MRVWMQWGEPALMGVLLLAGLYLSLRLGLLPVRRPGAVWRATLGGRRTGGDAGSVSPFQAMATALAGTVGTGNMVGVATALAAGGPGAVFWMWASALVGMTTKYCEILLTLLYRKRNAAGEWVGGPMHVLRRALGLRWLPDLFAAAGAVAAFGIGNMAQVNSAAAALEDSLGLSPWVTGLALAGLTALVILGGGKRIPRACARLVPAMAVCYLALAGAALWIGRAGILPALAGIVRGAFTPTAAVGGFLGSSVARTMATGLSRGIFTHEAGLGSSPIAHASAETDSPVRQGMWGVFEVFADTMVVCTVTALVILVSGAWTSGADGAPLTLMAFTGALGNWAGAGVALSLFLFALAAMLGWNFYGLRCLEFLTRSAGCRRAYQAAYLAAAVLGAVLPMDWIWPACDLLNACMILPNMVGVLALAGEAARETRAYFARGRETL